MEKNMNLNGSCHTLSGIVYGPNFTASTTVTTDNCCDTLTNLGGHFWV